MTLLPHQSFDLNAVTLSTVGTPVSRHLQEAEEVSVTGAGPYRNDSHKRIIQIGFY